LISSLADEPPAPMVTAAFDSPPISALRHCHAADAELKGFHLFCFSMFTAARALMPRHAAGSGCFFHAIESFSFSIFSMPPPEYFH
jgi:hypothetical protein